MATTTVPKAPIFPTNLPYDDGVPLESEWHRLAMNLLIELVTLHLKGRDDFFVGGNMFIYFNPERARSQDFRGPDFFFVWGVPLKPLRKYWAVWDEGGKFPDVIIELTSPTTKAKDHGVKKKTYEKIFHTHEYFIYDPDKQLLQGWRLKDRYRPIKPSAKGWLWCEELDLWLGTCESKYLEKKEVYLRFFDKDGNLVLSANERLEMESRHADAEKQRADAEKKRAEAAEAELAAAEAELARLKARLQKNGR